MYSFRACSVIYASFTQFFRVQSVASAGKATISLAMTSVFDPSTCRRPIFEFSATKTRKLGPGDVDTAPRNQQDHQRASGDQNDYERQRGDHA